MTIYYVSTSGSDSFDGLTEASAWKTIAKVSSSTFIAGDIIRFKCGDTWTGERLTIHDSGSANNPITYSTYSSGTKPIIDGDDTLTYGIYSSGKSFITIDGLHLKKLRKDIAAYGMYIFGGDNNIVCNCDLTELYYVTNPGTGGGTGWELNNIVGIYARKTNYVKIYNNFISDTPGGLLVSTDGEGNDLSDIEIYNNEITNFNRGLILALNDEYTNIDNVKIYNNYIHDHNNYYVCDAWHRDCIHIYARATEVINRIYDVEIYNNYFKDDVNRTDGGTATLYIEFNCQNFNIHHNIFNNGVGNNAIDIKGLAGSSSGTHNIFNNEIYCVNNSFLYWRLITNIKVKNNIVFGNYAGALYYVSDSTGLINTEINYNFLYNNYSTIAHNITSWQTLSQWQTLGYDNNSIFTNNINLYGSLSTTFSSAESFKLLSSSPAISAGTSVGLLTDYEGNAIPSINPSIGAYQYISEHNYYAKFTTVGDTLTIEIW